MWTTYEPWRGQPINLFFGNVGNLLTLQHASLYIYIYICRRVISVSTFLTVWKFFIWPHFYENLIFTAARSKLKVISLATREFLVSPLWGSIFDPQSGQTNNFPGGQTNNFHLALCFPYFRLIFVSFKQKMNWKPGGHTRGQTNNFLKFGCYNL